MWHGVWCTHSFVVKLVTLLLFTNRIQVNIDRSETLLYCISLWGIAYTYRCCTLHTYNRGEFAHFILTCNRFWHMLDMWNGNDHISPELTWIKFLNQIEIELKTCNNCLLCTDNEMNHIWKSNEQIKAFLKLRSWIFENYCVANQYNLGNKIQ